MPFSQLLVRLPQTTFKRRQLKDKITIHFQKSDVSNGFEVDDVNIIQETDNETWMTVTFSEPAGVDFVLSREKHHDLIVDGVVIRLEVKRHLPMPSWWLVSPAADSDPETFIGLDKNKQISEAKVSDIAAGGSTSLAGQQGDLPACQRNLSQCEKDQLSTQHSEEEKVDTIYPLLEKEPGWWQTKTADEKAEGNQKADLDVEDDEQLIEVSGLKWSIDDEVIKLYFENPRKSGGGEIEAMERDSKTGAVRIIFKNLLVAAAVEARKHKISGNTLKVKLITKKKRRPLPIKARCLFLKGIPDGCSSELVKFFIENRAAMDEEPTIQYGEKPGTALCTFSRDIPDLDAVVTNISKKKLQGAEITADKVHEADAVLVTGFPQDIDVDMIELYFDNKKKSGGSGVTDVKQGPMDGQAIVYFEDWKVVNEVLHRDTHKIGRTAVRVQMYHECLGKLSHGDQEAQETVQKVGMKIPQVDRRVQVPLQAQGEVKDVYSREGNVEEDYEQLIEVTGFKRSTHNEVLKLYFENHRKSGGGEIEMFERDSKTGAVRIIFKNPQVIKAVERRKHKVSGSQLKVKLITKKKRRPLPIKAQCLFLKGIPDGCSPEHVKLFVENRVSMDEEPTIQYGEKPGTALCTFSHDIPDLDAIVTNISKKKLQGVEITAEKVHESDAVLVQGFSKDLSVEVIELYFDNKKKSGGSGVREVQPGPMDGQAIVYFDDWKVVNEVLHRDTHRIGRTAIRVQMYHECLGKLSHGDQAFISNIPDKPSPEHLKRGKEAVSIKGAEAQETVQKVGMKIPQVDRRVQVPLQAQGEVEDVDTRGMFQGNLEEDYEQLIEVTGFKQTTDDEVMRLYFENPRKSGGGEIETMERDPKTGAVRFTFKNPSVAAVVGRKKHKLSGSQLKVKLITKKKRRPLPTNAQCLFLRGIPDGCSSEHVKLFIENRASMDEEPTIQYGEKPGTALCTFSRDIPDLDAVVTKVSEKKLQGVEITAEKVSESDAVLVQGFSQNIDVEMIELYFENPKKSGGSGVRDIQTDPMDRHAIVYFEDWKVVQDVLAKGHHKLGGTELLIESYHEFLGRLSQSDVPTPHIPKSVLVEVQEPIMEFLYGKGKNSTKKLMKELTKVKANLQWPDGSQKSQAKLEPVIDDSQHQSSWLNWEKEAVDVLTDFMKEYKTARVPVPQSLWKDAADRLKTITTSCSMVTDAQLYEVILVGERQDVDVTESTINDIIMKLKKEAAYNTEQAKQDIYWDAEKLQLFTLCGIKQEIEKSFPALKITAFSSHGKTGITLDGIRKTIKEVELQIRRMMDSLEKTEFKAGSIKRRFVQHVPDKIHEVLGSQNIRAACSGSDDGNITIFGATSRDVREAKTYIDDEIDEDVITIKGSALAVLQGYDGKKLLDCINKQKLVIAYVTQDSIELSGFKSKLEEAKSDIIRLFKTTSIIKEHIPCYAGDIKTIKRLWNEEIEFAEMENQANRVKIDLHTEGSKTGFSIEGNQEGVEIARSLCRSLLGRINRRQPDPPESDSTHTQSLGTQLHSDDSAQDLQDYYPRTDVPSMPVQKQDNDNNQQATVEKRLVHNYKPKVRPDRTSTLMKSLSTDETDANVVPSSSSKRAGFFHRLVRPQAFLRDEKFVTNGLTIVVRQGDLTQQQVHAIVSPSNRKLQHAGGASKAIEMAAGPQLTSFFAGVLNNRADQPLQVSECIVSPGYNLSCQNIIHVVGHSQKMSSQQFNTTLSQIFQNCLLKADESQARSLGMPLIGSGAVGAPKEDCANLLVRALANFSSTPNRFLNEVYLVNIDREATEALVQCCRDSF